MALFSSRTWPEWISQYEESHQHPGNRRCHTIGIPAIGLGLIGFALSIFVHRLWVLGLVLFVVGWIFQFVGHALEGKPPEFTKDWRFVFVGIRWWFAKVRGRV
jgi:uncharacterized membrane protein YGL010W